MIHDARFLRETVVDVDAAVVGISSERWTKIDAAEATPERAQQVMQAHRFDVLPVVGPTSVREYFRTAVWGDYSAIERRSVSHRDLLPISSPIREVIRGFATEARDFYFLASERRVCGLVSVVNLNCRQVGVWLFSLLSELETELAAFLTAHAPEADLLAQELGPEASRQAQETRARYDTDRAKGVDVPLVEYLYLSDLINSIAKRKLFDRLGYESRSAFEKHFNPMNDLRTRVAHPVRSLVTDPDSCGKLWSTLEDVEQALFSLRAA